MHPTIASFPVLPDDLRDKSFARTRDVLQKLEEMRRGLEMPADQLPIVIEIYEQQVAALLAEKAHAEAEARRQRLPLKIQSQDAHRQPMKIPPGVWAEVNVRASWVTFRPEDIAIHGDQTRWVVEDLKIGNRSQLLGHGPSIPGAAFGPDGVCAKLRLETVRSGMDFQLFLRYVGPEPEGEVFEATAVGTTYDA